MSKRKNIVTVIEGGEGVNLFACDVRETKKSPLYMRIQKLKTSVQGMGIWQDRAYVLHHTGVCAVYDLKTRQEAPLAEFPLGSYNAGEPAKDYANHSNSCMFSATHYRDNPIPLLYVIIGSGIGADEDGFYYRCAVENIVCNTDEEGNEHYHAETLQIISYQPEGIEATPYETPCWGCPAFLMDPDESVLYMFSARYRTKRECVPEGEMNRYYITKFPLPDVSLGGHIHLTPKDIMDQFSVDSNVMFTQGGTIVNGKLCYTFGIPNHGYPNRIMIFDLEQKCLLTEISDMDEAFDFEEMESCAPYNGKLLCNTNASGHGSIFVVDEPRLTEFTK